MVDAKEFFPTIYLFIYFLQKHWETIGELCFSNVHLTNFSFFQKIAKFYRSQI